MSVNDHLKTSHDGLEFIAKWEGCILKPYKDIAGLRTIGIGHLILPGENFPDGVAITREQAFELLAKDVAKCEVAIKKAIKVPLNQNQFDALVSFGFNCGTGVYTTSGACKALNNGEYEKVAPRLLDWSKAKINGVLQTVKGLYNRRKSEGELFDKLVVQAPPPPSDEPFELTQEQRDQLQALITKSLRKSLDSVMDALSDRCTSTEEDDNCS